MKRYFRTALCLALAALPLSGGCSYLDEYNYYTLDCPEYNAMLQEMNIPLTQLDYAPSDDNLHSSRRQENSVQNPPTQPPTMTTDDIDAVPRAVAPAPSDESAAQPQAAMREYAETHEPQVTSEDEKAMAEYDTEGAVRVRETETVVASVDPEASGEVREAVIEEVEVEEVPELVEITPIEEVEVEETPELVEITPIKEVEVDAVRVAEPEAVESTQSEVTGEEVEVTEVDGRQVVETVITTRTTTTAKKSPDYYQDEVRVFEPEEAASEVVQGEVAAATPG